MHMVRDQYTQLKIKKNQEHCAQNIFFQGFSKYNKNTRTIQGIQGIQVPLAIMLEQFAYLFDFW